MTGRRASPAFSCPTNEDPSSMTASTVSAPAAPGSKRTAAIVGGAALLVSLGAGAGWLMRGPAAPEPVATPPAQQLALAPAGAPATAVPPLAGDDEVAPPAKPAAPQPQAERAPARKPTPKPAPAKQAERPAAQPAEAR